MAISSILVANRGEIAVRIIRAAKELGIKTVQVFSTADRDSLPVQLADESIEIGAESAKKSYLNIDAILGAALKTKVDAIHPGYGFLAENPDFADAVNKSGFIFIGPTGEIIRKMGDKITARRIAIEAGVPVVPGCDITLDNLNQLVHQAKELGFPVMIKASAGGGGRGIRLANNSEELLRLAPQAAGEAKIAFGDSSLYLEKFIVDSRHIEVQVLSDGQHTIHLYERECSLQRRRQKIWEESPAISLTAETRKKLCESAAKLTSAVNYQGAGTIEYLFDENSNQYYFIEMNTRIQVEHPVTEFVTGVDLIHEMINIADGQKLTLKQSDIDQRGHAIEVRINAEDPNNNFLPDPGAVSELTIPCGNGVRFDHFLYQGYQIPPYYDSLLGKLIVYAQTRPLAIARLARSLAELKVEGLNTTISLLKVLTTEPDVRSGHVHTNWLENWLTAKQHQQQETVLP